MLLNVLFGVFIILQFADICTTQKALKFKNTIEKNPIVRSLINAIGVLPALISIKIVVIGLVAFAVSFYPSSMYLSGVLIVLNVFYTIIVSLNCKIIREIA